MVEAMAGTPAAWTAVVKVVMMADELVMMKVDA